MPWQFEILLLSIVQHLYKLILVNKALEYSWFV
jgi:hypothetical protein